VRPFELIDKGQPWVDPAEMLRSRLLLACTAALLLLLWLPALASAHAHLRAATPADGSTVDVAPDHLTLLFSGNVTVQKGSIQVFAPDGSEVEVGAPTTPGKGPRVDQDLRGADQPGTYGVAYRVSSEDGHVITGAMSFSVGSDTGESQAAKNATRDATHVDRGLQAAFSTTRFIEVLALLIAAGGGLYACLIAPGWRPRGVIAAVVVLLISYGVSYVLNAALAHGDGLSGAFDIDAIKASADTPFALSVRIRALVAVVALGPAIILRLDPERLAPAARWLLAVVFVALAASLSITGHAVTTSPIELRMPLDMVHVCAAAIWIGGLVQLSAIAPTASEHVVWINRFSRVAFGAVVVILITGTYATFAELGLHPGELVSSRYGRLIVGKLLLYAATLPLAWNNMTAFVPAIRARPEAGPRMLRQYVRRELFLLVVVLALTVWLIATPQPH
jgi:copper transport protein